MVSPGYVSVLSLDCGHSSKRFNNWSRTAAAKKKLAAIAQELNVSVFGGYNSGSLIEYERGGKTGIWLRPNVVDLYEAFLATSLNRSSWVYLFHATNTNYYKIGKTSDVKRRLKTCQVGCPNKIQVLYSRYDLNCSRTEAEIHQALRSSLLHGEWFELSKDDLAMVVKRWFE